MMDTLRAVVLATCASLLGLAVALVTAPALLGPLAPALQESIEPMAVNTGVTLALVGLATAVMSAVIANHTGDTGEARPDLESILGGVDSMAAGSGLDDSLARLAGVVAGEERVELEAELREQVRETAITVLTRTPGLAPTEARQQLENGTWTNDKQAAAFFSPLPPPVLVRIREWLRPSPATEQRLERAIAELEELLDLDGSGASHRSVNGQGPGTGTEIGVGGGLEGAVSHQVDTVPEATASDDQVEATAIADVGDHANSASTGTSRRFGLGVGLGAVAIGLVTSVTTPFLLGFLAVGYSLTKYLTDVPETRVKVTRVLASDSPVPGDVVEVKLTVENVGERPLLDLRIVDGAPAPLRVVEGSPSIATSLQPGDRSQISYAVLAKRGTFTFDDVQVMARDLANVSERRVEVTVPTRLTGSTRLDDLSLREQSSQRIGSVKTDQGGSGVEFYGTREYRAGDPMNQVNWSHLAKTGELTTVEFREQRAPTVAIVLDQREAARVAPTTAALDGVDLSVYAAERAFLTLLDTGTDVGLITYGERMTDIEPGSDATQRALVQSRLRAATDRYAAALGEAHIDAGGVVFQRRSPEPRMIDHHVPRNAQVILLSPATDDFALEVSERLAALGHPVTLLSPAVAATGSIGARQSRLDRACRLEAIRDQGTRVIDWHPDEPVQLAITRASTAGGRV